MRKVRRDIFFRHANIRPAVIPKRLRRNFDFCSVERAVIQVQGVVVRLKD